MKQLIFAITAIVLIATSCSTETKNEIKAININTALNKEKADISSIFENDIDVVSLQTGDNFLVGADSKKIFTDKHIFIADKISKRLHMFDNNGTFVKTIGNVGRGAGEYIKLTDFTLSED